MTGKTKRLYESLVEGAQSGLTDSALFQHVLQQCPKATSKKIVRASLLALGDPDLNDATILHSIYALAIKHRLEPVTKKDIKALEETPKPEKSKASKKAKAPKEVATGQAAAT